MIIDGIITTTNTNDDFINLVVKTASNVMYNIKAKKEVGEVLKLNHVYEFSVTVSEGVRTKYILEDVKDVSLMDSDKRDLILRQFMRHKDVSLPDSKTTLYSYIEKIDNEVLRNITKTLIDRHLIDFLTYPGGTRIHHSFLGGLAYHTLTMLKIADSMLQIYPYLKKDYLYAGIILHDLGKIYEFSDVQNPEFSLDGQMLGHLVIGAMKITEVAKDLGYENKEETLVLKHIVIAHHGQLQYGSARRPLTAEALLIWYLDTIDSKFQVIGDELAKTRPGTFTESIPVLDKMRLYKVKDGSNEETKK